MELTRRGLLQSGAAAASALSFSLFRLPGGRGECRAAEGEKIAEVPIIWMSGSSCTGCSVSLLNSASPTIQEVLLKKVLPDTQLSLGFHATLMAGQGEQAMEAMNEIAAKHKGQYILVVEGAVPTKDDGLYCAVGEDKEGKPITFASHVRDLGRNAKVVLTAGTCAAFGGIPAAPPNPTGCKGVGEFFKQEGIETPLINVPGCPMHPDWLVGTLVGILVKGVEGVELDQHRRPKAFFGTLIHDNCPYRGHFERGEFAEQFGEHGCLIKLGCKGPITWADCPDRQWNNGTNWCIRSGHPCIGCVEPGFPFETSMYEPIAPAQMGFPGLYPPVSGPGNREPANTNAYTAVGLIGFGGFLAGVGVTAAAKKLKAHDEKENNDSVESKKE